MQIIFFSECFAQTFKIIRNISKLCAYTLNSSSFQSFSNNWAYANDPRFKIGMGGVIIAMHCQEKKKVILAFMNNRNSAINITEEYATAV